MSASPTPKKSFLQESLSDRHVAAVSASGPFLMRRLVRALKPEGIKLLIELGPGDGVAGRAILPHLPYDATYIAIERNPNFVAALSKDTDVRETIIEGVAQDLEKQLPEAMGHADAVIASIPFTYLSKDERRAVVASAKKMLRPGGKLIIFHQYSPLMMPYMRAEFGNVTTEFEPLNVFPCFLMKAVKS